jgi:hypothetical protein
VVEIAWVAAGRGAVAVEAGRDAVGVVMGTLHPESTIANTSQAPERRRKKIPGFLDIIVITSM